jgi:hypothetical protein
MTKEKYLKIKERIDWLEDVIWTIELIDHWTSEDREYYDKYNKELTELKKQIVNEIFKEE